MPLKWWNISRMYQGCPIPERSVILLSRVVPVLEVQTLELKKCLFAHLTGGKTANESCKLWRVAKTWRGQNLIFVYLHSTLKPGQPVTITKRRYFKFGQFCYVLDTILLFLFSFTYLEIFIWKITKRHVLSRLSFSFIYEKMHATSNRFSLLHVRYTQLSQSTVPFLQSLSLLLQFMMRKDIAKTLWFRLLCNYLTSGNERC